jgi:hypothetical protein
LTTRPSDDHDSALASRQSISVLDLDPEVARLLSPEDRASAAAVRLPVFTISESGTQIDPELARRGAFGATLLDGLVIQQVRLGDRIAMTLLGPGDVIAHPLGSLPPPLILSGSQRVTAGLVRMASFGSRTLLALSRWPQLTLALYGRMAQQAERLSAQLVVCQLPRVEDRVLGLMWLLAEPWGKVTSAGTRLPLVLTHEAIGTMVGAQRPTISLALRELTDRGALLRQADGWLLLQPPPGSTGLPRGEAEAADRTEEGEALGLAAAPALRVHSSSVWTIGWRDITPDPQAQSAHIQAALHEAVARLQKQHLDNVRRFEQRLSALRNTRERCRQTRRQVARERLRRRPPVAS